jgi:GntP family gluconate:H+ symporter
MSVSGFLVILILSIAALMFLIVKANMHPVIALLLVAFVSGIALGFAPLEAIELINGGFAGTLKGVGIPIILGAVLAMGVQDTGAAKAIGNFFIKLFRGKNLELAPSLTAFIVSIPVFGDITMVLTSNIASVLSRRKGISMSTMATFTGLGLFLTHAMVPPTPGILAISILLGADLGMVILVGILVTFIAFIASWLLLRRWTEKEMIEPNPDFVKNIEPAKSGNVEDLLIDSEGLPGALESFMALLIPVVLIAAASFVNMYLHEGNVIREVLAVLGDKVVALSLAVIYTMFLGLKNKKSVIAINNEATGKDMKSMKDILLNSWVARGLEVALSALLITAMGGAFGEVIKSAPVIEQLGPLVAKLSIPGILIPWAIGSIMMTAVGSMTTAGMTAAAIVLPMMPSLGISPLAATLAIGAGTLMLDHINNSGFWVMSQFFNLNTQQGLKYITIPGVVASVISMIALLVLTTVGII